LAALFVILALQGAAGDTRAAHELAGLPRCAAVTAKAGADWKRVPVRNGFSLAMPACFAEVQDAQNHSPHGSQGWLCEGRRVDVTWGMWSQTSFPPKAKKCATEIAGIRAMVMTAEDGTVMVWYLTGTVHEPVVDTWSRQPDGLPTVQAIAFSGRVDKKM
jgi:hypothetical protein